jgi:spermine/spermidine synthase
MTRPVASTLIGLALLSAALLHLEIALTKIFSVVLWYHFGFLAIGIALLGFAAAGVFLTGRTHVLAPSRVHRTLACYAWYATGGIFLGFLLLTHSQFDTFAIIQERREAFFLMYCLEAAVPFFLLGMAIAAPLTAFPERIGVLYAANLVGSALGCLTAVVALNHLTGQQAVMASLGLAGVGAVFMALPAGLFALSRNVVTAAILLFLGFHHGEALFRLLPQPSKMIDDLPPGAVEVSDWSSLSKIDIIKTYGSHQGLWGISKAWDQDPVFQEAAKTGQSPYPPRKGILIDEWAITSVLNPLGPISPENPRLKFLEYLPAGTVHRLRTRGSVVCIGAGGGLDVATALYFGQRRVVGIEINRLIVEAVKGERYPERNYATFSGQLYHDPRVQIEIAEGRHVLERTEETFDVVQLSGVDTHSATEAGAFTLAENYLYTVEAFQTYLKRLKPDGVLTLTRWMLLRGGHTPTASLRLFVLAWEGLRAAGIEDPSSHIYFFRSGLFTVILIKKTPFTPDAIHTLDKLLETYLYDPLYRPDRPSDGTLTLRILNRSEGITIPDVYNGYRQAALQGPEAVRRFLAEQPYDVSAPTDDRPFFFELYRFSHLLDRDTMLNTLGGLSSHATLALLFLGALIAGYLFLFVPARRLAACGVAGPVRIRTGLFFGAIGLAYLLVEIPLSQQFILFLGQPAYALTVILFTLLIFSGAGSAVAGRWCRIRPHPVVIAALLIAAGTVAGSLVLAPVLRDALHLSLPLRVALTVAFLAPLGFLMGFPFTLGIRLITSSGHREVIPWAWAMNGYGSVLAAVGSVILGITLGFRFALWTAAALYVLAAVMAVTLRVPGHEPGTESADHGVSGSPPDRIPEPPEETADPDRVS